MGLKLQVGSVRETWPERGRGPATLPGMTERSPFRYFKTSPELIRLAVMLYVGFPLSLETWRTFSTSAGGVRGMAA